MNGIYREDGMKALVKIIEDNSDDEWLKYKLEIIEVQKQPYTYLKSPDLGHVFDVSWKKGAGCCSGMWTLDKEEDKP